MAGQRMPRKGLPLYAGGNVASRGPSIQVPACLTRRRTGEISSCRTPVTAPIFVVTYQVERLGVTTDNSGNEVSGAGDRRGERHLAARGPARHRGRGRGYRGDPQAGDPQRSTRSVSTRSVSTCRVRARGVGPPRAVGHRSPPGCQRRPPSAPSYP